MITVCRAALQNGAVKGWPVVVAHGEPRQYLLVIAHFLPAQCPVS